MKTKTVDDELVEVLVLMKMAMRAISEVRENPAQKTSGKAKSLCLALRYRLIEVMKKPLSYQECLDEEA